MYKKQPINWCPRCSDWLCRIFAFNLYGYDEGSLVVDPGLCYRWWLMLLLRTCRSSRTLSRMLQDNWLSNIHCIGRRLLWLLVLLSIRLWPLLLVRRSWTLGALHLDMHWDGLFGWILLLLNRW